MKDLVVFICCLYVTADPDILLEKRDGLPQQVTNIVVGMSQTSAHLSFLSLFAVYEFTMSMFFCFSKAARAIF